MERQPWDRRPDESQAAYARFLAYRNMGPVRTLVGAYHSLGGPLEGPERPALPGSWKRDSTLFSWHDRAQAWDVATLHEAGRRVAAKFVATVEGLALKALAALTTLSPTSWAEVLETVHALGQYVPAETFQRLAAAGRTPDPPAAEPDQSRAA